MGLRGNIFATIPFYHCLHKNGTVFNWQGVAIAAMRLYVTVSP
jgi:hypothetical protein